MQKSGHTGGVKNEVWWSAMSSSPDVPSADCVGSSSSSSSGPGYTLGGWVAPGFEALRDRMEDNLRRGSEARCQVG